MELRSVVPGKVVEVLVAIGDVVAADDDVMVIESMKMEVPVAAPGGGTVESLLVSVGDQVTVGSVLAVLA